MKRPALTMLILSALFTALMSLPFLAEHCGFMALFGLVPLLLMEYMAEQYGVKRFWIWHYGTFLAWNAITTFWVCNATLGGGIFACLANAFQMSLIFGLFRLGKKKFRGSLPYIFLAAAWIAWERYYLTWAQISWPWLVLGNAFARSTEAVQWYEWTGTLGGSLWIWTVNLGLFGIIVSLADGSWHNRFNPKARIAAVSSCVAALAGPFILSAFILHSYRETTDPVDIVVAQPNIDPYNKFQAMTQEQQNDILLGQLEEALENHSGTRPVLAMAPETFTADVTTNDIEGSPTVREFNSFLDGKPGTSLLFGASAYTFINSYMRPSENAIQRHDGLWYEIHNSALVLNGTSHVDICHKSKLVVGVEMTPYPRVFRIIDEWLAPMFGVRYLMGHNVGQGKPSVLHMGDIPFGCAICYESVYGEYCTAYVKEGARFLTIITNDAWWGNTPGYRQHLHYARLRAIETRRDIARCANTGISAFIDQKGNILKKSNWWERSTIRGSVNLNDKSTFFVENGDIVGRLSVFLFILLLAALAVRPGRK